MSKTMIFEPMPMRLQRGRVRIAITNILTRSGSGGDWAMRLKHTLTENEIAELINRRRRQILIHSIIYYKLDDNLISDSQWSEWANELDELQKQYPDISEKCVYAEAFEEFDPSTGFNLPLEDSWAMNKARQLLLMRDKK